MPFFSPLIYYVIITNSYEEAPPPPPPPPPPTDPPESAKEPTLPPNPVSGLRVLKIVLSAVFSNVYIVPVLNCSNEFAESSANNLIGNPEVPLLESPTLKAKLVCESRVATLVNNPPPPKL